VSLRAGPDRSPDGSRGHARQDVLPAEERAALLAARHRPNAALQVLSRVIESAGLRETQVAPPPCCCACRAAATQG